MDAIQLLLLSVLVFGIGSLASLLLNGSSRPARYVSGIAGMLGSLVGLLAVIFAIINPPAGLELPVPLPFGHFYLQMDGLSTLMIGMIAVLGFVASLYSINYLEQYDQRNLGVLGFFTNLFIAMMLLVVTVANAFYFLVFWEMMTLASYFLVVFESEKKQAIRAGYLYMLVAHAGGALIMVSFFLFYAITGSFDFDTFSQAQLPPALRNVIFLLAFIGFGAKAGMVPLHIWMPEAYWAAPSHVSALMASVMKKTAIYGILRICVDLLGASVLWWGFLVLFFGALSAVLGVLFALAERDLKRMLAYSSVENVGIILLGIGTGMVGVATQQAVVALLGFLAALYHALNHSFFKGLLFLGTGSVDYRLHTRDLNEMGGLARRMPWTGLAFLTGALAVAAIPPLNGFVSEWFTYQALFNLSSNPNFTVRVIAASLRRIAGAGRGTGGDAVYQSVRQCIQRPGPQPGCQPGAGNPRNDGRQHVHSGGRCSGFRAGSSAGGAVPDAGGSQLPRRDIDDRCKRSVGLPGEHQPGCLIHAIDRHPASGLADRPIRDTGGLRRLKSRPANRGRSLDLRLWLFNQDVGLSQQLRPADEIHLS